MVLVEWFIRPKVLVAALFGSGQFSFLGEGYFIVVTSEKTPATLSILTTTRGGRCSQVFTHLLSLKLCKWFIAIMNEPPPATMGGYQ